MLNSDLNGREELEPDPAYNDPAYEHLSEIQRWGLEVLESMNAALIIEPDPDRLKPAYFGTMDRMQAFERDEMITDCFFELFAGRHTLGTLARSAFDSLLRGIFHKIDESDDNPQTDQKDLFPDSPPRRLDLFLRDAREFLHGKKRVMAIAEDVEGELTCISNMSEPVQIIMFHTLLTLANHPIGRSVRNALLELLETIFAEEFGDL